MRNTDRPMSSASRIEALGHAHAEYASGLAGSLLVGYDAAIGAFFLEDHLSQCINVALAIEASDRLCIGVCQTSTDRRLFVGRMGGEVESAMQALAPVGVLTTVRLY